MRTQIFYFSGTGNSLSLAKSLAEKIKDAELISIPIALRDDIKPDADNIGIVYPVYATGLPIVVGDFLETIDKSNAYIFAVCNYALLAGKSLLLMNKLLQKKGMELSSGFMIKMPNNFIPFSNALPVKKQKKRFEMAEKRIQKISEIVKEKRKSKIERHIFPPLWLSYMTFSQCKKAALSNANHFWTDDKCISCGLCAKVCQFHNIKLEDGKPAWGDYCEQCMACLQWCPKEAIQFSKISSKRRRYHHPDIKAEEIFIDRQ
jgi:ferredoxin